MNINLDRDNSELSFRQRQKEIKDTCNSFKKVLTDLRDISHQSGIYQNFDLNNSNNVEVKSIGDASNINRRYLRNKKNAKKLSPERIAENNEIQELIRELYSMKTDLLDLKKALKRLAEIDSQTIQSFNSKITSVIQAISKHITRAELLLI